MTTLLAPPPAAEHRRGPRGATRRPARPTRPRSRTWRPWRTDLALLVVSATSYALVGQWLVREAQVVGFTALSRFDGAVGLREDPRRVTDLLADDTSPLVTLLTVPATASGSLVRSFAAVPAVSAVAAAVVLVVLHRWMRTTGLSPRLRLLVLAAVGLNPLVVQHATDGDALFVGLCMVLLAVVCLASWRGGDDVRLLLVAGIAFALAVLADRRMLAWLLVAVVVVALGLARTHRRPRDVEGTVAALLAPTVAVAALWTGLGLLLTGGVTAWLVAGPDLPGPVAATSSSVPEALGHAAVGVLQVAPLAVLVLPLLVHRWVARRDAVSAGLAVLLGTVSLLPVLLVAAGAADAVLLRDAVAPLLVSVLAACWLLLRAPRGTVLAGAVVALLLAGLPTTWRAMSTSDQQVLGVAFIDAVVTGRSQDGRLTPAGARIGYASEADMGDYLRGTSLPDAAVLADPDATFAVQLRSGRPALFRDRTDSPTWQAAAGDPAGSGVGWLLLSTDPSSDRLARLHPAAAAGLDPGLRVVHRTPRYVLVEVTDSRTDDPGGTDPEVRP